jgi:hypothetical protein
MVGTNDAGAEIDAITFVYFREAERVYVARMRDGRDFMIGAPLKANFLGYFTLRFDQMRGVHFLRGIDRSTGMDPPRIAVPFVASAQNLRPGALAIPSDGGPVRFVSP